METNDNSLFPNQRLTAHQLACKRGGRMVFEGLCFDLGAGESLHLKGNNGSGKSTLLRLLAGLLPSTDGSVVWGGKSLVGADTAHSCAVVYAGHQHGLKPVLTLRENCAGFYRLMTGKCLSEEKLEQAAEGFGLVGLIDQPLKYFSSGQTHRCALMRFLLLDRPIWLMDEPTVGLDGDNRSRLGAIMAGHIKRGGIIIAASHDPMDFSAKELNMADFSASNSHLEQWL